MSKKISTAQAESNKRWFKNNPVRGRYLKSRTSARSFVRLYANDEDIIELINIYMNENKNNNSYTVISLLKELLNSIDK